MFALIAKKGSVQAITQTGYVQGKMCTGQTHQAGSGALQTKRFTSNRIKRDANPPRRVPGYRCSCCASPPSRRVRSISPSAKIRSASSTSQQFVISSRSRSFDSRAESFTKRRRGCGSWPSVVHSSRRRLNRSRELQCRRRMLRSWPAACEFDPRRTGEWRWRVVLAADR